MPNAPTPSYISLFSSGGIADFAFKNAGFHCIASAELISRRLEVQRVNGIAAPEDLICGDLQVPSVYRAVLDRAKHWQERMLEPVTCILATPPCQGMSVANHKKGDELERNSLVVRSIEAVNTIRPLTFVFENVPAFMRTLCTGLDSKLRPIGEEIDRVLSGNYEFYSAILPLERFGSPSSRKRSITIGVRNDILWATPLDLFPEAREAQTVRELIGDLPSLTQMGEISQSDFLHAFRPYKPQMRSWIEHLPEGGSAFDNEDPQRRPHRVIDGRIVPNVRKNGDKYRRVPWDSIPPCVHTRNDILASQNTVHPADDRVFSIRELMRMMGLPSDFKWFAESTENYPELLRKHAPNIRQCLGEAMPYPVAGSIAEKIKSVVWNFATFRGQSAKLKPGDWITNAQITSYRILSAAYKNQQSAYYTQPLAAFALTKRTWAMLPKTKRVISVLEPSSGGGVFVALLQQLSRLENRRVMVTSVDIDPNAIEFQQHLFENSNDPNLTVKWESNDYLHRPHQEFDLILGNPPFGRKALDPSSQWSIHAEMSVRFLHKVLNEGLRVGLVLPKAILHAASYQQSRSQIMDSSVISSVLDFGELCFPEIKVETIGIALNRTLALDETSEYSLKSWPLRINAHKQVAYCMDPDFPTWIIYRDDFFDSVAQTATFGILGSWRDRTLSRKYATDDGVEVVRGRNLAKGYLVSTPDDYVVPTPIARRVTDKMNEKTHGVRFYAPNLSYSPRLVLRSEQDGVPDGSAAILFGNLDERGISGCLEFCNSDDFSRFFRIACNYATRSINLDSALSYWWGSRNR